MLFDLKKKKKKSFLDSVTLGTVPKIIPFDPLALANLQAAYYMNLKTQVPTGSLDTPITTNWLNRATLSTTQKVLQVASTPLAYGSINGFQVCSISGLNNGWRNPLFDLLNGGLTRMSVLVGFQRNAALAYGILSYLRNYNNTTFSRLAFRNNKLELFVANGTGGANSVTLLSANNYTNALPHVALFTIDQPGKTFDLYTDLGEHLSGSNLGFVTNDLKAGAFNDTCFGADNLLSNSINPCLYGDIIILNSIPTLLEINNLFQWSCDRLGIAHVVF